ncbi:hypothetical protein M2368_003473 [Arthrobacter sp. JUb119]|uniref:hypothetical protein n=1 Tax=Arthrobacter sp. JUb115 TaxID=2485108 RepID=UPI00105B3F66|nr:hypothetical protein [Arthrobacter sp. JUb115]MCS3494441.1 hypothetical protein [Arthrobacter sp. JUb119]TDU22533.1 hypothetical protein EDF61_10963 [Arthrobacter sp. JUb115]
MPEPTLTKLPEIGLMTADGNGAWHHFKDSFLSRWAVGIRSVTNPNETRDFQGIRKTSAALNLFFETRANECNEEEVTEIYKWIPEGWLLINRASMLRTTSILPDTQREIIWAPNGQFIGLVHLMSPDTWAIHLLDPEDDPVWNPYTPNLIFKAPDKVNDAWHTSRATAIATAHRFFPNTAVSTDDYWPKTWAEPLNKFRAAGISAGFKIDAMFIGPSDATCTAPDCMEEAKARVERSGSDIGTDARLACYNHAGELMARHSMPPTT